MSRTAIGLSLVAPALVVVVLFFVVPLVGAVTGAFHTEAGYGLANFAKTYELYSRDILFTFIIVAISTVLIAVGSTAIAGYLTLGSNDRAVSILRWLYRWPLFIPFIVVGQILRTFLAKNGLMNNMFVAADLVSPMHTTSFLDWRGIVIAFVWKQIPFVTLLLAGAMASLDRGTIEAARNLGASRLRILVEIVLPQVASNLMVGLTLSVVTMMSVLSVPLMINAHSPTMITVNMAFRINAYGDYGVANALGLISLVDDRARRLVLPAPDHAGERAMSLSATMERVCPGDRLALAAARPRPRPARLRHLRAAGEPASVDGHGALVLPERPADLLRLLLLGQGLRAARRGAGLARHQRPRRLPGGGSFRWRSPFPPATRWHG